MFPGLIVGYRSYGSLTLTASPAQTFVEPLTLTEVQSYLRVATQGSPDDDDDALITSLISAAREQAEILQGRDLVVKQWDLSLDYWPSYSIEIGTPLISVDLMQYRDANNNVTVMTAGTDFIVDASRNPGVITPLYGRMFPLFMAWPSSAILVRFKSGVAPDAAFWSDAGARIKIGMKMLISHWYNNRLPAEKGAGAEYPYAVTSCLSYGAIPRVR